MNDSEQFEDNGAGIKDIIKLIRLNLVPLLLITFTALIIASIYAINTRDIYKSTTQIKITKLKGGVLDSPLGDLSVGDMQTDRFILNEIEVLKCFTLRRNVASALADSFTVKNHGLFYILFDYEFSLKDKVKHLLSKDKIAEMLEKKVTINQKRGLDIVEISVESPSPYEAALIANCYAKEYYYLNLDFNRLQMKSVKEFLQGQQMDRRNRLREAEEKLLGYQKGSGMVDLDEQSKTLIKQVADFEAKRDESKIDLTISEKNLTGLKNELGRQEPKLKDYMESVSVEPYLKALQEELARYEIRRDVALSDKFSDGKTPELIAEYDKKIADLRKKRDEKIKIIKAGIFASSSEQVKGLATKAVEEEIKYQSLSASYKAVSAIVTGYESKFNSLPQEIMNYARLERDKAVDEKLYLLIEEKFQETQVAEQSTQGNAFILDPARIPSKPAKPNRPLIVLVGFVIGLGSAFGYVFVRNMFDTSVKTPNDIQALKVNLLGWVPGIEDLTDDNEFIIHKRPKSIPSEAYRAVRTRVQFTRMNGHAIKTLLITSSSPSEGKTLTAVNLAGSFAQAGRKTLLIDCDLRKPRLNKIFKIDRMPGFTDYIIDNAEYSEIIKKTELENLSLIPAGIIPPNPSEILGSSQFVDLLKKVSEEFDMIVLDAPPVLAVTDAEILSRIADATILIARAEKTDKEILSKSVELLQHDHGTFAGVLLNNFNYRDGYGSYYKNYYYYSGSKKKQTTTQKFLEKIKITRN